jgi:CRISPR-associated protein Csc1
MEIYRGRLDVLDYVFYATVERGKVYETGAFIHNYALAYALRLAASPYTHQIQKPDYARELRLLNERGIYLTPARPLHLGYRLTQWNTIQETYGFGKKPQSIGYPDWGFARVLKPGSTFEFYVLIADPRLVPHVPVFEDLLAGQSAYIRLGKFLAKARVGLVRALKVSEKEGPFTAGICNERSRPMPEQTRSPLLLNWRDIPTDPILCDVYPATLPTRLIANPQFADGRYYRAEFGEEDRVILPAEMRFIARPI